MKKIRRKSENRKTVLLKIHLEIMIAWGCSFAIFLGFVFMISSTYSVCPPVCTCDMLNVDCKPGLQSFPLGIPPTVVRIFADGTIKQRNTITRLEKSTFAQMRVLRILKLSHSSIKCIEDGAFLNTDLRLLDLSNNELAEISELTLSGIRDLYSLDLTNNLGLDIPPHAFKHTPKLKMLYLGELNLSSIANVGLQYLTRLTTLDLHGNCLTRIDLTVILTKTTLKYLDISGNLLTSMPNDTLSKLPNLKNIALKNNPWDCNCETYWIRNLPNNDGSKVVCTTPKQFQYLTVVELDASNLTCAPVFVIVAKCLTSYKQKYHTSLTFTCAFGGNPQPEVTWIRPDGARIEYYNFKYPGYSVSQTGILTISQLDGSDNGKWTITLKNILRQQSFPVHVEVTDIKTTKTTTSTSSKTKTTTSLTTPTTTIRHTTTTTITLKTKTPITEDKPKTPRTTPTTPFTFTASSQRQTQFSTRLQQEASKSQKAIVMPYVYYLVIVGGLVYFLTSIICLTIICIRAKKRCTPLPTLQQIFNSLWELRRQRKVVPIKDDD